MTDINFTQIESNGINMRLAQAGEGPLVLLIHGWPESWYSWRHQPDDQRQALLALAAALNRDYRLTENLLEACN